MLETSTLYGLLGIVLAALGLHAAILQPDTLRRILAINILGVGVFLVFIATAYNGPDAAPDAVPHALVLTGIVVAVAATALALALLRRLEATREGTDDE
jgi:multicomponent Na+:H+ antiporter subunit C